ncbi:MAG TPA: dUTP diphosphatase [Candidatus Mcinerneyibacteriales bacterium]|nr:dUTP diphosphatase [Candidatus Mcinerneyibacteriales bacterium]HPE20699.1 dUTP diphosphatase [Candidatus Mcinerneyibacteriales bacterium]HPQ89896.1 dUTP diphosphatase [Candidatus Mcinerneyibacteriales bacterium]
MEKITIRVFRDINGKKVELPCYMSRHAAGMDVRAAESKEIPPGKTALVRTGLFVEVPPGYELQVRPRSGLALKHRLLIPNAPGTIDADYRGEVGIILMNGGDEPFFIEIGDRVAQLVLCRVYEARWEECDELNETGRGGGGFGHTGTK